MSIIIEDTGLLVGLISYPFEVDGSEFFEYEFQDNLFDVYKKNIAKDFEEDKKTAYLESDLYQPAGYHLFGNYNLAVLSLVDGYAFGNRIFHPGHSHSYDELASKDKENTQNPKKSYDNVDYNYQLLTGISYHHGNVPENDKGETHLNNKVKATLRKTKNKYPFIGITRFKLNNSILIGTGMEFSCVVRETIEKCLEKFKKEQEQKEEEQGAAIDAFTIDCFGNSEITLLTFSNNLMAIYDFICQIKDLRVKELISFTADNCLLAKRTAEEHLSCAHIFSSSYTNAGYDIQWEKHPDLFYPIVSDKRLKAQIKWEMKPGHDSMLGSISEEAQTILAPGTGVSKKARQHFVGGNALYTPIPFDLVTFDKLMKAFGGNTNITRHIKNFRVQFYHNLPDKKTDENIHPSYPQVPDLGLSIEDMKEIRNNLRQCGASKLTKERVLKMLARYNNCIRDKHFYIYFIELRDFLKEVKKTISAYAADTSKTIEDIDNYTNQVITAFESAYYNRFHQSTRMGTLADINLEYNGGIQQYVTSFDLVYKEALKSLSYIKDDKQYERSFVYVSGYENVISKREMLRINMNLITYPELFAVSIFKETGNYIIERYEHQESPGQKKTSPKLRDTDQIKILKKWRAIIHDRLPLPSQLLESIKSSPQFNPKRVSHQKMARILDHELIEYFIVDIHNLHFGFNNDFDLMYYFYWKYFLQISQAYDRSGELRLDHFTMFLTRLLIIQLYIHEREHQLSDWDSNETGQERSKSGIRKEIMDKWHHKPFDPHLSNLWYSHFEEILDITIIVWESLQHYQFYDFLHSSLLAMTTQKIGQELTTYLSAEEILKQISNNKEASIPYQKWVEIRNKKAFQYPDKTQNAANSEATIEFSLRKQNHSKIWKFYEQMRALQIEKIIQCFRENKLVRLEKNPDDPYFVSNILIAYLSMIREVDNPQGSPYPIRQLTRNESGKVQHDDALRKAQSPLLSDPQGGIFTHGSETRRLYFTYRTILYKSLWDYAIKMKKDKIWEAIEEVDGIQKK